MPSSRKTSWPAWTNSPVELYHGTLLKNAEQIAYGKVDVTLCRMRTDFGRGFYTTTSFLDARRWARQVSAKSGESTHAVVQLSVDRTALGELMSLCFVRHSPHAPEYWSFVQHCRQGRAHIATDGYYDVVCGPIALLWGGPSGSAVIQDSDQFSFHSEAAQSMLNDGDVCRKEVLA